MTPDIQDESIPIEFAVLNGIRAKLNVFTPRQRAFAEFVLHNPESLAFLSIQEIAREARVSEATIVRFCHTLEYDGYTHLVREVRQTIRAEVGSAGRFKIVRRMRKDPAKKTHSAFERFWEQELDNMTNLAKSIKAADFHACLEMMETADQICIVGCMSAAGVAQFFGDVLSRAFHQVDVITGHSIMASAIYQRLTAKSLVFLISFAQYARATSELGQLAAHNGANVVAITDDNNSPIVPLATISFLIPVSIGASMQTLTAPMAFISMLVSAFGERCPEKTEAALLRYDEYTSQMKLYKISREQLNLKSS